MERTARNSQQILLSDSRKLGYDEHGAVDGLPVFFMHGFPGSRLDWRMFDNSNLAQELNVRIIALDRPGMDLSDFQRGRELLDWADDMQEAVDALHLEKFAVLAISGGGPYGAFFAFKLRNRLTATAIVWGMGPAYAPGMKAGGSWTLPGKPALIRKLLLLLMAQTVRKQPERMEPQFLEAVSDTDRELWQRKPELIKLNLKSWDEAFKSGTGGVQQEAELYKRSWGFELAEIQSPVLLWQGTDDDNVPPLVGHYMAQAIPNCRAAFMEGEGHFTLPYRHMGEVLRALIEASSAAAGKKAT